VVATFATSFALRSEDSLTCTKLFSSVQGHLGGVAQESVKMDEAGDPADELIAMFGKITTNDHESLVTQFARILNTDLGVARFFLEASSWSVEQAVHTYLAETKNGRESFQNLRTLPVVTFLSDLSRLQEVTFEPGFIIDMEWTFRNDGVEGWPSDTRIAFVDGERMQGFTSADMMPVLPGQICTVHQRLLAPPMPGTYAGTWRLVCSAGYFGDPVWVIVTVGHGNQTGPSIHQFAGNHNEDEMMDL